MEENQMLRSWNQNARWTHLLVVSVMLVPLPSLGRAQDGPKNPNEQKNASEAERLEDERPVNGGPANELIREFVIEGTCTDADHAPLAEVNLQLYASGNDRNRPLQLVSETKTDEQGTFRFSDLEPPRPRPSETNPRHVYTLVATSAGRATSVHSIGSTHLQAPRRLVLWNSRTLRGRVTNAAGNPIEGATVSTDRATLFRRLGDEFSRNHVSPPPTRMEIMKSMMSRTLTRHSSATRKAMAFPALHPRWHASLSIIPITEHKRSTFQPLPLRSMSLSLASQRSMVKSSTSSLRCPYRTLPSSWNNPASCRSM
jgi:hypothetical protein